MNIRKHILFVLALTSVLSSLAGLKVLKAQTSTSVNVTVTLTPPYSPYYSDYSSINASKVLLILQNTSGTAKSIKLSGTLTGDNGIKITTKSNYVPLSPLTLNPYETKQLNGLALKDIFDINALNVYGIDKSKIAYTSRIPEGNYVFCIQALDYNTGQALSANAPLGCTPITIAYPDAPVLINPLNQVNVSPTTPQSMVFNWINAGNVPIGTQYQLQLVEMPGLVKADPNQILSSASFPLINKTLSATSYVLSPADPQLKPNALYAWRVRAFDPAGKTVFKNDGFSTASTFNYSKGLEPPLLISPANEIKIKPSAEQTLAFIWEKTDGQLTINYTLQVVEVPSGSSNLNNLFTAGKYLINETTTQAQFLFVNQKAVLQEGKKYAWRIKASSYDGSLNFNSNGLSNINTFEYTSVIKSEALAKAPVITSPSSNTAFKETDNSLQPNVNITWTATTTDYAVAYEIKVIKVPQGISADMAVENNLPPIFSKTQATTNVTLEPDNLNPQKSKSYIKLEDEAAYAVLVTAVPADTTWYYAQQKKLLSEGKQLLSRIENNGQSKPVIFTYSENKTNNIVNTPISTSITGRLFYRYKEEKEQPKETNLGFPLITTGYRTTPGTLSTTSYDIYDNNKYPDAIATNRFPMGSNPLPLKNVGIRFLYVIYKSKTKNPTRFTDIEMLSEESVDNTEYWQGYNLMLNGNKIQYNIPITTAKAKSDGSYKATFDATYQFGYLGTQNNISYFGGVKLIISENGYYTSPDLVIFPKIGKTAIIPDDIVFARSYNLNVKITASKNTKNQALEQGSLISNYPFQLIETGQTAPAEKKIGVGISETLPGLPITDDPLTLPLESNADSYKDQFVKQGGNYKIIDNAKTDANGIARFKNLLLSHSHSALSVNNPFEGTITYQMGRVNLYNNSIDASKGFTEFNSNFETEVKSVAMELEPKKPEIYLRAITIQNGVPKGIPNVSVHIVSFEETTKKVVGDDYYNTDENGYFKLTNLNEKLLRTITLTKYGFGSKQVGTVQQKILLGERFPATTEQEMLGGGRIAGYIVNEAGKPVECNIKVADGPYIKTNNGSFVIENTPIGWLTLQVIPTVDNYFAETLSPVIKTDGSWTLITNGSGAAQGRIVLKEKLHRVQFKVVDENGKAILGASVNIGNTTRSYLTQSNGLTSEIAIASPDDEFKIGVSAVGYVKYDDYVIIPLAKETKVISITLKTGQTINGIVLDAQTKKPIKNARVYTVNGTNADGEVQNETYTDANGKYSLSGVISNLGYLGTSTIPLIQPNGMITYIPIASYGNLPVKIYAVKSGENAYLRQEKSTTGTLTVGLSTANFELQPINANAEIWGLPIEINTLTSTGQSAKISGAFIGLPENNVFKTITKNVKIPFKDLTVNIKSNRTGLNGIGGTLALASNSLDPVTEKINLELTALKVTAFGTYDCEVLGTDVNRSVQKLNIEKNGGNGLLKGYITSELTSFNFSYNYTGKFLLNTPNNSKLPSGQLISFAPTTLLPVFYANASTQPAPTYNLSALYGKTQFNIHNFKAKLVSGSFDKSAFYLDASVDLQIPLVGISTLPAGQIKVTSNSIAWNQYNGDINIPLEKWAIKGKGLTYDVNKGGFNVINGTLATDMPQIDLKNIMIMPQSIDLGENSLSGKETLTLGGVAPLKLRPSAKLTLNFDDAAPFDQNPHYRLNISGNSDVVAFINELPAIGDNSIDIKMLSSYSDAKHRTVLLAEKKLNYFNVISQNLSGIDIGNGFFTLIGNTDIGVPGASNNVTGRFKFVKDNGTGYASKNGVTVFVDKLQTDVEMAGKVRFEGESYTLNPNSLSVTGKVLIYKNSITDAIPGIKGNLTKTVSGVSNTIKMDILQNQKIALGNKSLAIINGGSQVTSGNWNNLKFTGQPQNYTATADQGSTKNLLVPGQDLIDFEVKGGIETDKNSKKQIQVSDMNTPFGNLSLAFDFDNKLFQGSLTFTNLNMILGPVTLIDGTIDVQMDPQGFLMVGTIQNAGITVPLPDVIRNNFKSGMALGYYNAAIPNYMKSKLLGVTLYNELPSSLNTGLKGFYVNVMRSLSKSDLPQLPGPNLKSIPVVGAFVPTFDFSAGIDMYAYLNVGSGIGIGGKAFAQASCYYDLELCTIGLSGGANGAFDMQFSGKELSGKLVFGINGKIAYCVGSLGIGVDLLLIKDGSGFKFKPSLR